MRTRALLVVPLAVLLLAGAARAELMVADSIEWAVSDSDYLAIGKVVVVALEAGEFRVGVEPTPGPGERVACISPVPLTVGDEYVLCLKGGRVRYSVPLSGEDAVCYSRDLKTIEGREAILAAVRAAEKAGKTSHSVELPVPPDSPIWAKLYGGSAVYVKVPLDSRVLATRAAAGLDWLAGKQIEDGSFGGRHSIAVTSFAVLAILAASDRPFEGPHAQPLLKGLGFLMGQQKDGLFPLQGHTWIHGQGFATLALAEAFGRAHLTGEKPDLDLKAVKAAVAKAVKIIARHQSTSGGWWYTQGNPGAHEGSTTVTAVQALVAARNFGIEIDESVLAKGFEYLKKCQNSDGGFDYQLGPGEVSMKEGTAADVATLALMRKFDYQVMMKGYRFLLKIGPGAISRERFPYYGHFYATMGMMLLKEEFTPYAADIDTWTAGALRDIIRWQNPDGSFPLMGWVKQNGADNDAYSTAYAALLLSVRDKRLSIYNREAPGE
jgi:hypothetical protein